MPFSNGKRRHKSPPPGETGQEALYLKSLSERQVPVTVKLRDGERVNGWIEYFDDTMIRKQGVQMLPGSLEEALDEFAADEVIQSALGAHVGEWFLEAKRAEWNEYRTHVTSWELERYLMTY